MKKLNNKARVAEVADACEKIVMIYNSFQELNGDEFLRNLMQDMKAQSELLKSLLRRHSSENNITELDHERDLLIRRISQMLTGYEASPISNISQMAADVKKIFVSYTKYLHKESQSSESALIKAMLDELNSDRMRNQVNQLQGMNECLSLLRQKQEIYDIKRLEFERLRSDSRTGDKASKLSPKLLKLINNDLYFYVTGMAISHPETYKTFELRINETIISENDVILLRKRKKEKDKEEAEEATEETVNQ